MAKQPAHVIRACRLHHHNVDVEASFPAPKGLDAYEGGKDGVIGDCLHKDEECYEMDCPFCTEGCEWPLEDAASEENVNDGAGI